MSDWVSEYSEVLRHLKDFTDYGNGRGRSMCPACDTGQLWLSVADEGQLIFRCYPRHSSEPACRSDAVIRSIGLTFLYCYPGWRAKVADIEAKAKEREKNPRGGGADVRNKPAGETAVPEGEFQYWDFDPAGKPFLSFVVMKKRWSNGGKDFPQKRPNPDFDKNKPSSKENPEWLWDVKGKCRPCLYRLPDLRAALDKKGDRWVFVVEGEQDVETVRALDLIGTCNPGGTGKWLPAHAEELRGRNVVVIGDDDPVYPTVGVSPGIEHAKAIARSLIGVATNVRLMVMPKTKPCGDITDWRRLQQGTKDDVRKRLMGMVTNEAIKVGNAADVNKLKARDWTADELAQAAQKAKDEDKPNDPKQADSQKPTQPAQSQNPPQQPKEAESPPVQQPTQSAPPAGGSSPTPPREFLEAFTGLMRAGPPPRGVSEWLGDVWAAAAQMQAVVGGPDKSRVREAAVLLAAHLLRGVAAVPELSPPAAGH